MLKEFPKNVDKIKTKKGIAFLLKTDIFKRQLFYAYRNDFGISEVQVLSIPQVNELKRLNDSGVEPETLTDIKVKNDFDKEKEQEIEFVDNIDGVLHLKPFEKKKRKRGKGRKNNRKGSNSNKPKNQGGPSKSKNSGANTSSSKSTSKDGQTKAKVRNQNKRKGQVRKNQPKQSKNNSDNEGSNKE